MSDSESDDEFLSADEGDLEDGDKKIAIDEEEVDEIMDMLMNNQKVENDSIEKQHKESVQQPNLPEPKCNRKEITQPSLMNPPKEPIIDELSTTNGSKTEEISEKKIKNEEIKLDKEETPEENLEDMIEESIKEQQENNAKKREELDNDNNKREFMEDASIAIDKNKSEKGENKESDSEESTQNTESIDIVEAVTQEIEKQDGNETQVESENTAGSLLVSQDENNTMDKGSSNTIDHENDMLKNKTIDENNTGDIKDDAIDDTRQSLDDLDLDDPSSDEDDDNGDEQQNQLTASNQIKEQDLDGSIPETIKISSALLSDSSEKQSEFYDLHNDNNISDPIEKPVAESVSHNVEENLDQGKQNDDIPEIKKIEPKQIEKPNIEPSPQASTNNEDIQKSKNINKEDKLQKDTSLGNEDHKVPENLEEDQGDWGNWGNEDLPEAGAADTGRLIFKKLQFNVNSCHLFSQLSGSHFLTIKFYFDIIVCT